MAGRHPRPLELVIAGVQKAGTTTLFEYLRRHPDLAAPDQKELHLFDDETRDWSLQPQIDAAFGDRTGRRFEATPIYLFWPRALERLRAHNPRLKLILIFRDPIERAYSHWRMESARGDETLPFSVAIRDGRDRLRTEFSRRHHSYVERGFYGRQLRHALDLFHREQLLLLSLDDLASDPQETLRTIATFAGIAPFEPQQPPLHVRPTGNTKQHPASQIDPADAHYLANLFAEDLATFTALSYLDTSRWSAMC